MEGTRDLSQYLSKPKQDTFSQMLHWLQVSPVFSEDLLKSISIHVGILATISKYKFRHFIYSYLWLHNNGMREYLFLWAALLGLNIVHSFHDLVLRKVHSPFQRKLPADWI
jgi:hypothetical protein